MLIDEIRTRRKTAKILREEIKGNILTTLLGELENIAKRNGTDITDDMVVKTCKKFIASNDEFLAATKDPLVVHRLTEENNLLELYLPSQLTEDELKNIIIESEFITVPEIMKFLKENYSGKYDGKVASRLAKELSQ
jgi:uncharacterized protein YqeY